MKCYLHPEVDSIGVCVNCGNFICADCKVDIEGRIYCRKCSEDMTQAIKKKKSLTKVAITEKEIKDGKIWAVMGYLGILCLFPLLLKKDNRFALFHAKQGLVLFIFAIATGWIPVLGWFFVAPLLFIAEIIGIIQALRGKCWKIPGVGDLAEKISM